jgi:hypothetical protein
LSNYATTFDPLLVHMEAVCKNMNSEFAGALLWPHGPALKRMLEGGISVDDVLEAAKDAGHQPVQDGKMYSDTLKAVSRELLPLEMYVQTINQSFQQTLGMLEGA